MRTPQLGSHLGERDLIEAIRTGRAGAKPRSGDVGIGDDCAVVKVGSRSLLLTIDLAIEGVHFDLDLAPADLVGGRAVAAALSDIAAMGGTTRGILVSLAIPRGRGEAFARALTRGIHREARANGAPILGGDTTASSGPLVIDVAAFGEPARGGPILRRGARVGDLLCVSGTLGGSAEGLRLLRAERGSREARGWIRKARARAASGTAAEPWLGGVLRGSRAAQARRIAAFAHLRPAPRLALGRALADARLARAMIDLSDGLSSDLHTLLAASGVGAEILAASLPLHPALGAGPGPRRVVRAGRLTRSARTRERASLPPGAAADPLASQIALALGGGEEYELLFAAPRGSEARLSALASRMGLPLTPIGRVVPRKSGVTLVGRDGRRAPLPRTGYEHVI